MSLLHPEWLAKELQKADEMKKYLPPAQVHEENPIHKMLEELKAQRETKREQ